MGRKTKEALVNRYWGYIPSKSAPWKFTADVLCCDF
jgi:hypothetical protein